MGKRTDPRRRVWVTHRLEQNVTVTTEVRFQKGAPEDPDLLRIITDEIAATSRHLVQEVRSLGSGDPE